MYSNTHKSCKYLPYSNVILWFQVRMAKFVWNRNATIMPRAVMMATFWLLVLCRGCEPVWVGLGTPSDFVFYLFF